MFETLWTFFHIQQLAPGHICALGVTCVDSEGEQELELDTSVMEMLVRENFERRIVRPVRAPKSRGTTAGFFAWPDENEVCRFDLWMREYPRGVYRGEDAPFCATSSFDEDVYRVEPEESLYWGSADEEGQ